MSELTSKTNKDTTSMKWITILALVYLPGNFVCVSIYHNLSTNQHLLTWRILDVVWNESLRLQSGKSTAGHRRGLLDLRGNMATTYPLHLSGILLAKKIPRVKGKWSFKQDESCSIKAYLTDRTQEARHFRPRPWIVVLHLRAGIGSQSDNCTWTASPRLRVPQNLIFACIHYKLYLVFRVFDSYSGRFIYVDVQLTQNLMSCIDRCERSSIALRRIDWIRNDLLLFSQVLFVMFKAEQGIVMVDQASNNLLG